MFQKDMNTSKANFFNLVFSNTPPKIDNKADLDGGQERFELSFQ